MQNILHLGMMNGLKVVFVGFQGIRTAPGHVANHLFFPALHLARRLGHFMDQPHHLADMPMAESVDVQINADHLAQPFPMRDESGIPVGLAPGGQKQGVLVTYLSKGLEKRVKPGAILMYVSMQKLRCLSTEANDFHAPSMTALVTGGCLAPGTTFSPVADGQCQDLGDA